MQIIKNNTSILVTLLYVSLALLTIYLLIDIFSFKILNDAHMGIFHDYTDDFDLYTSIFYIIFFVVHISVFIVAGVWLYRSHKRLRVFGVKDLRFSDGSCVWWYFVPLMNLFKPYQTMRETWFASQSPNHWALSSSPILLKVWWFFWIVSNIVGNAYLKISLRTNDQSLSGLEFLTTISIFSTVLDICATIAFLLVVKSVNKMQLSNLDNLVFPEQTLLSK